MSGLNGYSSVVDGCEASHQRVRKTVLVIEQMGGAWTPLCYYVPQQAANRKEPPIG
jgi:hypothetical protein